MYVNDYLSCSSEDGHQSDLNADIRSVEPELRGLTAMSRNGQHTLASTTHPVAQQLTALTDRQRQELACAMSMLWDEFVAQIRGPAGWETCSRGEQAQYIRSLAFAAERIRQMGGSEKAHYALAPELMALYVHALREHTPSQQDREVAALALSLVARGAQIRREASGALNGSGAPNVELSR